MAQEWQELAKIVGNRPMVVERVRLIENGIAIEGEFELPQLLGLSAEDQVFLAAFVRSHGSIKKMEQFFGVSYPTIKNRLNKIADQLEFVEIDSEPVQDDNTIDRLERGEITVEQALESLREERKS